MDTVSIHTTLHNKSSKDTISEDAVLALGLKVTKLECPLNIISATGDDNLRLLPMSKKAEEYRKQQEI